MPFVTVAPSFAPFLNILALVVVGLMAAEFCGSGCGWCGRCDAADLADDFCKWCECTGCDGQCDQHFDELSAWADQQDAAAHGDPAA